MGLTSALNTSLNGLALNETKIDVLGNNIANAGTNGFKASDVLFHTQLSQTLSVGSRPTSGNGGTNPQQIGLGASTASISKNFLQGSISNTNSESDLAIQGEGFFVLGSADGIVYSRAGNFSINGNNDLINPAGLRVQGYAIDDDFNLVTTQLADLEIPVGDLNVAQATSNVTIKGTLSPTGAGPATQGAVLLSETLTDTLTSADATGAALLTNLEDADGNSLFTLSETLSFAPRKGLRVLEAQTLEIEATTTLNDLMTMMEDTLGTQSGGTIPQEGGVDPGVTVTSGQIRIIGNQGTANDILLEVGDLFATDSIGGTDATDINFVKSQASDGESTITDFVVYDSLGTPINMKMTAVLQEPTVTTTTPYRYFLESVDNSDPTDASVAISSGIIGFDGNGVVSSGGIQSFSIDRDTTAAFSPMQVTINFTEINGLSKENGGSESSNLSLDSQDGSSPGTLIDYAIDESGTINGVFDNGVLKTLGQIALARFANNQGLVEAGETTFREGVASGSPTVVTPGNFGGGTIRSGSIELSNTDVGQSLVDLIIASTNYRGNARVIDSVQNLVDELLVLGR